MEIKDAQYKKDISEKNNATVLAIINGIKCFVPMDENNRHYQEILKQVKEGTLTIKDAD